MEKPQAPKNWNDAPILYLHTVTVDGLFASLPMKRTVRVFEKEFKGVPGTEKVIGRAPHKITWHVPGYTCINCQKTFFVAEAKALSHVCTNFGGYVSEKA